LPCRRKLDRRKERGRIGEKRNEGLTDEDSKEVVWSGKLARCSQRLHGDCCVYEGSHHNTALSPASCKVVLVLKHHFMKTYGGVEVKLCVSLISALDGGEYAAYVVPSLPKRKSPWYPLI
jgi:hypothetical protein